MTALTHYKRNDRLPVYAATLLHDESTAPGTRLRHQRPIDLDGTTVTFIMRAKSSSAPKVEAEATVVDAEAGAVSYAWAVGDLATAGTYLCEWQVTYPDGRTLTVPSSGYDQIRVLADLDT